ncbi:ferrochelatase [Candidatus Neptunochlamydia vexilliferae]|uniref:Ferrochelatase n=1 Tax=Candidatus Neptunichlamydia vexilliferae TaxID=1651774 RepID=A0ABS0AX29_9BACT|nr:ferrochelatase [Candidatus Neptunochlamydia vexilliferae]MBF5058688.1 Ferrochelatase [Candidatus Neptunochlamydia vexilliferae]
MSIGVLLVNLGTPTSSAPSDVKRYLTEFLTDGRVIDLPPLKRNLLVRGIIVPKRYKESAKLYQSIWTKEGSPLLVYGKKVEALLQEKLGEAYQVKLAMRYQTPSIEEGLNALKVSKKLIILPLFPQYASATTGSVHQKVFDILSNWEVIPEVRFIDQYASHPTLIDAFCARGKEYDLESYDHIVFSYHGLPERQLRKADQTGTCLKTTDCCQKNPRCYAAQCLATTKAIVKRLYISPEKWSHCFQSRLGKDPWIKPYTGPVLQSLVEKGAKRVLVFCPAFVADCLETLEEIGSQYRKEFTEAGGEVLDLVRGLNDHPKWIDTLEELVR